MPPYATVKRLRDGRTAVRLMGPGGLEVVAIAPPRFVSVGGVDEIPIEVEVAGIFDDIAKAASKVLKNKWVKTAAAGVLAAYGVPPGVTTKAMQASGNLIDMARGDPRAAERLKNIAVRAAGGDPVAQRAHAAVEHSVRVQRQSSAAVDAVAAAVEGDQAARRRLETIAARARAEPNNAAAQQAARAVQAVVTSMQRPPPPAVAQAAGQQRASAPRCRIVQRGTRRVIEVDIP